MSALWRRWLPTVLALWLPAQLPAYTVEPNLLVLGAAGADSSGFVRLANKSPKPAAIELVISEFDRDPDGRGIVGASAGELFIVYPAQLILLPGDEASVQVRWIGPAQPEQERAYSLTTREVVIPAVDAPRPQSHSSAGPDGVRINVNVLVNYDVRVYVRPRGARADVVVEAVSVHPQQQSQPDYIEVTLANRGSAHRSLRDLSFTLIPLAPDGRTLQQPPVTLTAQEVPGTSAALLAGGRRVLRIARPVALPYGPVRVLLSE